MSFSRSVAKWAIVIYLYHLSAVSSYDGTACCNLAKINGANLSTSDPLPPGMSAYICGQSFIRFDNGTNNAPAPDMKVSYQFCKRNCSGYGLSNVRKPREWAAPVVQFVLPAVIFSMTIPRRKKFEYKWYRNLLEPKLLKRPVIRLLASMTFSLVIMIPVIIDTILWIFIIITGAANMVVGGLHEALLDYRIIQAVSSLSDAQDDLKTELLVVVVSGNLKIPNTNLMNDGRTNRDGNRTPQPESPPPINEDINPQRKSPQEIAKILMIPANLGPEKRKRRNEKRRARLLYMLSSQSSFGAAVGAPVLFYLGAFVYTILDLLNMPSDQDAAISLAFGVEWMIIVHVAIISGCLLASNNPSTSSAIVGLPPLDPPLAPVRRVDSVLQQPLTGSLQERFKNRVWKLLGWADAYETPFQPVSMWDRGSNKIGWVKRLDAWNDPNFKDRIKTTFWRQSFRTIVPERILKSRLGCWTIETVVPLWGWVFEIFIPTLFLIALPPAAGAFVAYSTPPVGWGCRSLSFMLYAASQVVLAFIATLKSAVDGSNNTNPRLQEFLAWLRWILSGWRYWFVTWVFYGLSLFTVVGGTMMQFMGVYKNCKCYVNANYWFNLDAFPGISVATDTQGQRDSANSWITMGSVATVFMGITCYLGWWYQNLLRQRYDKEIEKLYHSYVAAQRQEEEPPQLPPIEGVHGTVLHVLHVIDNNATLTVGTGTPAANSSTSGFSRQSNVPPGSEIEMQPFLRSNTHPFD